MLRWRPRFRRPLTGAFNITRRAIHEIASDWHYERRTATTWTGRGLAFVAAALALARVLATAAVFFDDAHPMRNISRDLRDAVRRLRATPMFTTFAVVTMALGLGITTGIYSAVHEVLSPPAGVAHPERLVRVLRLGAGGISLMGLSWPEFQEFQAQQDVFDRIAGWSFTRANVIANRRGDSEWTEVVSAEYFQALGIEPQLGRLIQPADDRADAPPVAVISHQAWRRWFDATPGVLGQTIKVNGLALTIVGVAPKEFSGMFNGGLVPTAVWLPMAVARPLAVAGNMTNLSFDPAARGRRWILVNARLASGHRLEDAIAQVTDISAAMNRAYPEHIGGGTDTVDRVQPPWTVTPIADLPKVMNTDRIIGPITSTLLIAVILVLLVACTNLANLMLARNAARRAELAVRLAMGATRWRLLRENVTEGLLIAFAGGVAGLGVAKVLMVILGTDLVIGRGANLRLQPHIDMWVGVAAMAATALAFVVTGLGPALQVSRTDVRGLLVSDNAAAFSSRWRGRRVLIAMQVAVSAALVTVAASAAAQVLRQSRIDLGVDFDHLAIVEVDFAALHYDEDRARAIVAAVIDRATRLPGVVAASASSGLPAGISAPGVTAWGPTSSAPAGLLPATPAILDTLGVTLQRGRTFSNRDTRASDPVAMIGDKTAIALFGSEDVIGRTLDVTRRRLSEQQVGTTGTERRTVVGIVSETHSNRAPNLGVVYVPWSQRYEGDVVLAARTGGDPAGTVAALRQLLRDVDPEVAVAQAVTGPALLARDTLFFRIAGGIASILGTLALLVALVGLYGILSVLVSGRTREIGIRMALGADAGKIRRRTLGEGLSPVMLGLVLGIGLGLVARLALRPMFTTSVPTLDFMALVLVPALFLVAGFLAAYLPARRASRVDPSIALRRM